MFFVCISSEQWPVEATLAAEPRAVITSSEATPTHPYPTAVRCRGLINPKSAMLQVSVGMSVGGGENGDAAFFAPLHKHCFGVHVLLAFLCGWQIFFFFPRPGK